MQSIIFKISSTLACIIISLNLTSSAIAGNRTFNSPTQFKVCADDSNFTRPTIEALTNYIIGNKGREKFGDRFDIEPDNHTMEQNKHLVAKRAGRLFNSPSIIYDARSGSYGYDTSILSGEWNNNIKKWNCSNKINDKARFTPDGDVSIVVLFGYRIKDIQKRGNFYVMLASDREKKGIQYIAVDRKLNGKLKIETLDNRHCSVMG